MHLSVFDLDHTLVKGNSSFHFCKYLFRRKVFPVSSLVYSGICYVRHYLCGMSLSDLHQKVFDRFLRGRSLEALEVHVESFVEEYLSKSLYMPAVECLKRAQHLGHYTLILSNSPSFLVKAVSQFLGVHEWKATEYAVDQERKLCNISSIMQGEDKAKWLEKVARRLKVHKDAVTAYSDSHLDLPFLRAAGRAIAVNPNRKLRQYSRKHQWSVL